MKIYQVTGSPWGSGWHYRFCVSTDSKYATVLNPESGKMREISKDNFDLPGSSLIYSE